MMRKHVDPVAGEITPITMVMLYVDWQALRAGEYGALADRTARRARVLYWSLTAMTCLIGVQMLRYAWAFLSGGSWLALGASALEALLVASFLYGERRLYRSQREVVVRLRALAESGVQPPRPDQAAQASSPQATSQAKPPKGVTAPHPR